MVDVSRVEKIDARTVGQLLRDFESVVVYAVYRPGAEVSGVPESRLPPRWREGKSLLALEYGLDMPRPVHDLACEEDGVRATLSFGTELYPTFVPYASVLAIRCDGLRQSCPPRPKPKLRSV